MIKVFVEVGIVRLMEVYEKINVKKKKKVYKIPQYVQFCY